MFAEEVIDAALFGDSGIVAITGPAIGPKGGLPTASDSAPAISYERVSTVPTDDLTSNGDLDEVRMQIDCWGRTAKEAAQLASLVRDLISPADSVGLGTLARRDGPTLDIETRIWGVGQDFIVWEERT